MANLAIKGVAKSFGRVPALNGIDLTVPEGEFCVIAGPSGSGKSTLLRVIAGLEQVDAGTIEIDGEVVNDLRPRERDVAMVFQSDALFPAKSVYKNIAFSLKARKTFASGSSNRQSCASRATARPIATRRRCASESCRVGRLSRSVMPRSSATLLTRGSISARGVEAELRDQMRDEIKLLHREFPTTKIYVTRDPVEAMTFAERTVLVREGRVEQEGTPLDLFERPLTRFVAGFFGWPKMNFLAGALSREAAGDVIRLEGGTSIRLPPNRLPKDVADGLSVILGLRPEHMMRAVRASPPDGVFRHGAEIELVRPMGSRTYATFRMGDAPVVAELLAHDVSRPGERIPIDINLKRASIFDATTEKAL